MEMKMRKLTWLTLLLCVLCAAVAGVAAQDGGEKPKPYTIENTELKLADPVVFAKGSDKLSPEAERALVVVKDFLNEKTYISLLRVEGHTDAGGGDGDDATAGQQISQRRALAVARWLVEKGVDCKRVLPVGFGATKPVAPNDTAEGRRKNRRLTFALASLRGRLIGGQPADGGGRSAGDPCAK
jgi:OOP family OmpA-OmpF porin